MVNGSAAAMKILFWYRNPCIAGPYTGQIVEGYSDGLLQSLKADKCLPQSGIFGKILVLYLKHILTKIEYQLS